MVTCWHWAAARLALLSLFLAAKAEYSTTPCFDRVAYDCFFEFVDAALWTEDCDFEDLAGAAGFLEAANLSDFPTRLF